MKETERLGDLFGKDLLGWKITWCYFLELNHGLWGNFPVITVKDKIVVAVTDKSLLKRVWDLVERRRAKISKILAVVNFNEGIGFNLEGICKEEMEPIRVFSKEALDLIIKKRKKPFEWLPGLFGDSTAFVKDPDFDD